MSDDKQARERVAHGCQRVFRHQVAKALYTDHGDPAVRAALESLGAALQLQAIDGPPGSRNLARIALDTPPGEALASLLRGEFTPDDLVLPRAIRADLADDLAGIKDAPDKPAPDKPAPDKPTPRGDGEQPDRRDGGRRDGDRRVVDYELWLQVTKIHCERETPGPGSDRLLLDGRAEYNVTPPASDVDRPLDGYVGPFDAGDTDRDAYKLFEVRVPQGLATFKAFINPLESDGMSRAAARKVGYAIGGLLTGGVNAAYAAIVASGQSAGLTAADAARDLIADYTLPWLIGLIARWFGPEQFNVIEIDATTERDGAQVTWGGTVSSNTYSRTQSSMGPGTLAYPDVAIQQQEADEDDDGHYVLRFLRDGGLYKLDLALTLVQV